jgi:multiple sugar transport system substrate-binding protein
MIPKFLAEGAFDDAQYALPFMRSTEACYVNKTYVEKLGFTVPDVLTWDFVFEVSEAAMAQDADGNYKVNGQKVLIPFIYKSTDNMMIQYLQQAGAPYSDDAGTIGLFNDTTKAFLNTIADSVRTDAFSTFKISGYPANFLNAGQCIFAIDSTAGATWIGHRAPQIDIKPEEMVDFEVEVMTVPQFDPEHPQMISQGPSMCIFNKEDPQEVLASWLFMQYMLTNEVQLAYSGTEGYVPVTEKAQASAEYADYLSREGEDNDTYYDVKIQAAKLLLENTENTFVTPVFNGSASLRNAAGQLIEEVTKGVQRKKTVDDAFIANLYESVTSLYRLDQIDRAETGEEDMGPLPTASILLLATLVTVWVGMGIYVGVDLVRKKKRENRRK